MPVFLAPIAAKVGAFFAKGAVKWIAIGIVILVVAGTIFAGYRYVVGLQETNAELSAKNASLKSDLSAAQQATLANFSAYQATLDRANRQSAILDSVFADKATLEKRLKVARDNVGKAAAQPSGDAPVAPALEEALNALRTVKP